MTLASRGITLFAWELEQFQMSFFVVFVVSSFDVFCNESLNVMY